MVLVALSLHTTHVWPLLIRFIVACSIAAAKSMSKRNAPTEVRLITRVQHFDQKRQQPLL